MRLNKHKQNQTVPESCFLGSWSVCCGFVWGVSHPRTPGLHLPQVIQVQPAWAALLLALVDALEFSHRVPNSLVLMILWLVGRGGSTVLVDLELTCHTQLAVLPGSQWSRANSVSSDGLAVWGCKPGPWACPVKVRSYIRFVKCFCTEITSMSF